MAFEVKDFGSAAELGSVEDLVERLLNGGEEEIDELAQLLVVAGKSPEEIVPTIDALSQNQQIWTYDFEGNMEGQNLDPGVPAPAEPVVSASAGQEIAQRLLDAGAAGMANSGYLSSLKPDPTQPVQWAGTPSVGSAALAGTPTTALYGGGGPPTPGLGAFLRRTGNG